MVDEDLEIDNEQLDQQASKLGCIEVGVERVTRKSLSQHLTRKSTYKPLPSADTSKEMVKRKYISHAMA